MIGQGWEIGYQNARGLENAKRMQIGDNVYLLDNSEHIKRQVSEGLRRGAMAVGEAAVGMIKRQMISGYQSAHKTRGPDGRPTGGTHTAIRDTGALINDVQFDVEGGDEAVTVVVGNTLRYALFVHDGTRFVQKRPYIRDAIQQGWGKLLELWGEYVKP